ncbi:MAG: insulinase family protein [Acholeplasmatales bacterium]|nr:insulinase family protein [Acholeplasmatales bacterium]
MRFIENKAFNLEYYDKVLDCGLNIRFVRKKGFINKAVFLTVGFGSNYKDFTYNSLEYHLKSGIAHAIEHKIYENSDGSDAFRELSMMGVDANAFTTTNFTCYHFQTPNDIIKPMLKTFDFVLHPYFNKPSLDKEIPIILEEKSRKEEDPYYWYDIKMVELLYKGSARVDSVLGSEEDIKSFKPEDLYDGYNAFYKPSNMSLIVVGDVDFDLVYKEVNNYFLDYKNEPCGLIHLLSNQAKEESFVINNQNIEIPKASIGFKMMESTEADFFNFQALFYYMYSSSGDNRLKMLNEGLINTSLDVTVFHEEDMLYGVVSIEDEEADVMLQNILDNLESFDIKQMNEEDLILFKRYYLGGTYSIGDNISVLAESMAFKMAMHEDFIKIPELINNVTLDDVYNAFNFYKNAIKVKIFMK